MRVSLPELPAFLPVASNHTQLDREPEKRVCHPIFKLCFVFPFNKMQLAACEMGYMLIFVLSDCVRRC